MKRYLRKKWELERFTLKQILRRYADWTRRQGSTAQCSPALGVLGAIVVFGAVIYVYRQIILTTIYVAVCAAIAAVVLGGTVALTVNTIRWYRKRERAMVADPSGAVALATVADDQDTKAIGAEADWLADAGSELVFDSDGNLHAKTGN